MRGGRPEKREQMVRRKVAASNWKYPQRMTFSR
jgi:hypothetical protein